jgi:hypothetical protein
VLDLHGLGAGVLFGTTTAMPLALLLGRRIALRVVVGIFRRLRIFCCSFFSLILPEDRLAFLALRSK